MWLHACKLIVLAACGRHAWGVDVMCAWLLGAKAGVGACICLP